MKREQKQKAWQELAEYLELRSKDICQENKCTEDDHNCESNAYITEYGSLIDICISDYFQGWGSDDIDRHGEYAVVPLPWIGNGQELRHEVEENLPFE